MDGQGATVNKPRLLDLYSCAGGAARGYQQAGFHVTGIDIKFQPRYAGDVFICADALEYVAAHGHEFDAIHASPPCQRYTCAQNAAKNADAHPDLIDPTRDLLIATGKPYIIENVVGAPMQDAITLCGLSFGLKVKRHRLFEVPFFTLVPPCQCRGQDYYVIFGHEVRNRRHGQAAGRKNKIAEGRKAMDIDWMTRGELTEAIPPAYTKWLGERLMEVMGVE